MDAVLDPKAFQNVPRVTPKLRPMALRRSDWHPVHEPPDDGVAQTQAGRCMGCGVPFCQSGHGCPAVNLVPEWNELVTRDQWRDALAALHETNNFPEFTGHLCPAPCESACVLSLAEAPVTIKQIELAIVERGFREGWIAPRPPVRERAGRVVVVGSGPAGLAAAQQLRRLGHAVTVLEKADKAGGLLRYGIPDFKMDKQVLDRRLAQLAHEGVEFRTGVELGRDVTLAELREGYDAVCLAIGAERPRDLAVPGRELGGIHFAMDFLSQQNRRNAGLPVEAPLSAAGRRVVILGGGDTGSDCLGTAIRQGCRTALQLEVRGQPPRTRPSGRPWPLVPMTLTSSHAHEEGGQRLWSVATVGFSGSGGRVERLHAVAVELRDGQPVAVPDSEFAIDVDLVLLAMGFTGVAAVPGVSDEAAGLERTAGGALATGSGYATSVPGVFAAGDARRGASLIVWAIAEGRKMAAAVAEFLA